MKNICKGLLLKTELNLIHTQWPQNGQTHAKFVSAIFLSLHQIRTLKNYEKCFLFKVFFCSQDIQVFIFAFSPLFPFVSHCSIGLSKMSPKVYDVINWLNKNLKTLFDILRKKVGLILKLGQ